MQDHGVNGGRISHMDTNVNSRKSNLSGAAIGAIAAVLAADATLALARQPPPAASTAAMAPMAAPLRLLFLEFTLVSMWLMRPPLTP